MLGYGRVAPKYEYEMPQMLKDAGYYTFGIGKMHWYPQRVKHGFDGTLLDESGRRQDPHFTSDYRQWFQVQAPGKNPDATGIMTPKAVLCSSKCLLPVLTVRMIRRNVFWICMITSMFPTRR